MSKNTLNEILNDRFIPYNVSTSYTSYVKNVWSNVYFDTKGRNLYDAISVTFGYRNPTHSYANTYRILTTLCNLIYSTQINIYPAYLTINSSEALSYTLEQLTTNINEQNRHYAGIAINLVHIPKGKTYLKQIFQNGPEENHLKNIEIYFSQNVTHYVKIYKNLQNTKEIYILTDIINVDLINMLVLMLPNLLTSIVPDITETENAKYDALMHLFSQLYALFTNETNLDDTYKQNITKEINHLFDLCELNNTALTAFTKTLANRRVSFALTSANNALANTTSTIQSLEEQLHTLYQTQYQQQRAVAGITETQEDDTAEFLKLLQNSKNIAIVEISPTQLKLNVTAPLQYFIPSDFTFYEENPHSTFSELYKGHPIYQHILHKIFVTREYSVMVTAAISISLHNSMNNNLISVARASVDYDPTDIPNPHIHYYNCWSGAINEIQKYANQGNYILMLNQIIAAVQTVNIAEGATFVTHFLYDFLNYDAETRVHIMDNSTKQVYPLSEIIQKEKDIVYNTPPQNTTEETTPPVTSENDTDNTENNTYHQIEIPDED